MSEAPPIPGMTSTLVGLGSPALSAAHAAHMRGADFFFFKLADVGPVEETIEGQFFRNGAWEPRRTPFPDVIDNDTWEDVASEGWQALVKKCRITMPFLGGKLAVDQAMRASGKFDHLLIPTAMLESPDHLVEQVARYQRVVVKPEVGGQGRGVFYVARKQSGFFVNADGISQDFALPEFTAFVARRLANESLIVQQYVASRTAHGQPHDVRIHVRRDGDAEWQIVYINARIGSGTSIAANLATGGSLAKIEPFLKHQFGPAADQALRRISAIAQQFPPAFQLLFPGRTITALGIDVGLDDEGHPRLFEVNSNPSAQFAPFYDHMCRISYAIYLVNNPAFPMASYGANSRDMTGPQPSSRKAAGIALILLLILIWARFVASLAQVVGKWPILVQALFYLFMGLAWIIPLKPLLRWSQTGRWSKDDQPGD